MTREEKEQAVDAVLSRYDHLGATLVADDQTLVRILQTLELSIRPTGLSATICVRSSPPEGRAAAGAASRWWGQGLGPPGPSSAIQESPWWLSRSAPSASSSVSRVRSSVFARTPARSASKVG